MKHVKASFSPPPGFYSTLTTATTPPVYVLPCSIAHEYYSQFLTFCGGVPGTGTRLDCVQADAEATTYVLSLSAYVVVEYSAQDHKANVRRYCD